MDADQMLDGTGVASPRWRARHAGDSHFILGDDVSFGGEARAYRIGRFVDLTKQISKELTI